MAGVHRLPQVQAKLPAGYKVVAKGNRGEIYLYGIIGQDWFGEGITAKKFADDLKALGDVKTIDLYINSEGGSVFEGKAMYSKLNDHPAEVIAHVDGLAASAASFVAMAGDRIEINEGAFIMIHNAWTFAIGNAEALRKEASLLDSIDKTMVDLYAARTKNSRNQIEKWMAEEKWFDAEEAVSSGFADKVIENKKVAALTIKHPETMKNLPAALDPRKAAALTKIAALRRP